jgi:hypothetical protein
MCSDKKYLVQPTIIKCPRIVTQRGAKMNRRPARIVPRASSLARRHSKHLTIEDCQVGFPIRTSRDQRVLSPPPGLSQSATSFIASCCQGIHQTPLSRLIRSRRRRALLREELVRSSTRPSAFCSEVEHDPCRLGEPAQSKTANDACAPDATFSVSVFRLGKTVLTAADLDGPRRDPAPTRARPQDVSCFALSTMSIAAISRSGTFQCRSVRSDNEACRSRHARQSDHPARGMWWVEEELNLRPHAYQACALTT